MNALFVLMLFVLLMEFGRARVSQGCEREARGKRGVRVPVHPIFNANTILGFDSVCAEGCAKSFCVSFALSLTLPPPPPPSLLPYPPSVMRQNMESQESGTRRHVTTSPPQYLLALPRVPKQHSLQSAGQVLLQ